MSGLRCFKGEIETKKLDRTPFDFSHKLVGHPFFEMDNLEKVLRELPKEKVSFSKELNDVKINLDDAFTNHTKKFQLADVFESIRTSKTSYIAARNVELHESFRGIFNDLLSDIGQLMKKKGTGSVPMEPIVYLFIASPTAVTPFHFDRSSNFIFQIRGSKELVIYPPKQEEVITQKESEAYMDWSGELPQWREDMDPYAHKFNFKSGEAAHIPFTSGHYVKNGPEDISITMSIFFHTDETLKWSKAMKLNNRLRRFGMSPKNYGVPLLDDLKAGVFPALDGAYNLARKLRDTSRINKILLVISSTIVAAITTLLASEWGILTLSY